jgi:hypothetical protein
MSPRRRGVAAAPVARNGAPFGPWRRAGARAEPDPRRTLGVAQQNN